MTFTDLTLIGGNNLNLESEKSWRKPNVRIHTFRCYILVALSSEVKSDGANEIPRATFTVNRQYFPSHPWVLKKGRSHYTTVLDVFQASLSFLEVIVSTKALRALFQTALSSHNCSHTRASIQFHKLCSLLGHLSALNIVSFSQLQHKLKCWR